MRQEYDFSMLNGDFYRIIEQEDLHFKVQVNADHKIYQGHFPEYPITPGACLLQMTQELLSIVKGRKMHLQSVTNLKFVAVHTPDQPIMVDYKALGNEKYQVTIYDSTTIYAKMSEQYLCANTDV